MRILFEADHPLVLNGTYDQYGYTPKERRALERRQKGSQMAQPSLPGTSGRIKALEDLGSGLLEIFDERKRLKVKEDELKIKIAAAMRKARKTTYTRDGLTIEIVERGALIKVKGPKVETDDDDDEAGADA